MSTRSRIAIKRKDGSYDSVYCHFDGYPSGVGNKLVSNYNNSSDAEKIIKLGDLSVLGSKLEPNKGTKHTFDEPQKGVTIAYGRDRGETNVDAIHSEDIDDFEYACDNCDAEYAYVWDGNDWIFYEVSHSGLEPVYESCNVNLTRSILNNLNESLKITNKIKNEFENYQPIVNEVARKLFDKYKSEELSVKYNESSYYTTDWGPYTGCFIRFTKNNPKDELGTCVTLDIASKDRVVDEKEFKSGIRYIKFNTDRNIMTRSSYIISKMNKDDINETSLYKLCVDSEQYKKIDKEIQAYLGKTSKIKKNYGKGLDALRQRLEDSDLFYDIEIGDCDYDEFDYHVVVNTYSGDWIGYEESEMIGAIKDSGYKYRGSEEVGSGVYEAFFNEGGK